MGWEAQLARLAVYKAVHGDCNVQQSCAEDKQLGHWVHNQRYYKKALDRGERFRLMSMPLPVKS